MCKISSLFLKRNFFFLKRATKRKVLCERKGGFKGLVFGGRESCTFVVHIP